MVSYLWSKIVKKLRLAAIRDSAIHSSSKIESGSHVTNSTMGRHSFCGYDCEIYNCDIGAFTSIANCVAIGGGEHPTGWVGMSPVFYEGRDSVTAKFATHRRDIPQRTTIGHDVWIGHGVHIRQGVTVGNGAVIGMGSVVTRDVEPYTIVAGCPAKVIRRRFDDQTVRLLQESAWWDFDDATLRDFAQYFTNPQEFLVRVGKL